MSYQLTIEPLGATIEVEEGQTVLDAALRQGIYLPHACGHGLCGSCKVNYLEGEVDHQDYILNDDERARCLTVCVSRAKSPVLVLDI